MKRRTAVPSALYLISILILYLIFPASSMAYLILDASFKGVYEDNVNSAFSGANRPHAGSGTSAMSTAMPLAAAKSMGQAGMSGTGATGTADFYAVLSASVGSGSDIGTSSQLFIKADASRYQFSKFTDLNSTGIGASAGVFTKHSDLLSTQVVLYGKRTDYGNSDRNSTTFGGNIDVKERFSPELWLKERAGYEKNDANTATFSYKGPFIGLSSGILVAPQTTITFGYLFADRKFDDGAESKSHSLSAGIDRQLTKQFDLFASYEHMKFTTPAPGTNDTDNIYTVGISYSY